MGRRPNTWASIQYLPPQPPLNTKERADRFLEEIGETRQMIEAKVAELRKLSEAFYETGNSVVGDRLAEIANQISSDTYYLSHPSSSLHQIALMNVEGAGK